MSIRSRLAAALAPEPEPKQPRTPYRETPVETPADVLDELEARMAGLVVRVRVLERQLLAQGIEPASTPSGYHLRRAADLLEHKGTANTIELGVLADMLRGLAAWSE